MEDAFGTVDPVDAEDEAAVTEAAAHMAYERRTCRGASQSAIGGCFDTDWKNAEAHAPLAYIERASRIGSAPRATRYRSKLSRSFSVWKPTRS